MELNEYQNRAMKTCMDSCYNFSYMMLNLVGEVGELASKVAKHIRKEEIIIRANDLKVTNEVACSRELSAKMEESFLAIQAELGDCLWQISGLCRIMGMTLEDAAQANLDKLASRKQRGVIDGNGDNR